MRATKAFTFIEILMLIAMAALLIGLGTDLARTDALRSRVAEERQTLLRLRTALQNFHIDHGEYPGDHAIEDFSFATLTTPVSYLPAIPRSVFGAETSPLANRFSLRYWSGEAAFYGERGTNLRRAYYAVSSVGPDSLSDFRSTHLWERNGDAFTLRESPEFRDHLYDPTNGTRSSGDLVASPTALYN